MSKRMTDLSLLPFAWLASGGHDGSNLNERNVMMHIRNASIIEIFQYDDVVLNEEKGQIRTYIKWNTRGRAYIHDCNQFLRLAKDEEELQPWVGAIENIVEVIFDCWRIRQFVEDTFE